MELYGRDKFIQFGRSDEPSSSVWPLTTASAKISFRRIRLHFSICAIANYEWVAYLVGYEPVLDK